jgi:hypothetical protein
MRNIFIINNNIYITHLEVIVKEEWYFYNKAHSSRNFDLVILQCLSFNNVEGVGTYYNTNHHHIHCYKIVATSDINLIKSGVQKINDKLIKLLKDIPLDNIDVFFNEDKGYYKLNIKTLQNILEISKIYYPYTTEDTTVTDKKRSAFVEGVMWALEY